ncbi:hypothetical protein [Agrobacterium sp. LAD9]|uniref:hypothetical protein n=1 Tax=Agrobacterium sp. LAD9 TaxID=2055153 RepID=UPI00128FE7ED|nr:hypothetical protein [Agrobacterium sp. LAD9]
MIPFAKPIQSLSIYRDGDRDVEGDGNKTEKKTKTKKKTFYAKTKKSDAHSPKGLFALDGAKASRSRFSAMHLSTGRVTA